MVKEIEVDQIDDEDVVHSTQDSADAIEYSDVEDRMILGGPNRCKKGYRRDINKKCVLVFTTSSTTVAPRA